MIDCTGTTVIAGGLSEVNPFIHYRELLQISEEIRNGEDGESFIEHVSFKITQAMNAYLVRTISLSGANLSFCIHRSRAIPLDLPR